MESRDAIVIGGGHNGLGRGLLPRAGRTRHRGSRGAGSSRRHDPRGDVDPSGPRHLINSCALDTVFLPAADTVADLGLARYGVREIESEPANVYLRGDGSDRPWRDSRRTAEEIGRFSAADAEAYLDFARVLNAGIEIGLPFLGTNPCRPEATALARMARVAVRDGGTCVTCRRSFSPRPPRPSASGSATRRPGLRGVHVRSGRADHDGRERVAAGSHPSGGVTELPGRLAARELLRR